MSLRVEFLGDYDALGWVLLEARGQSVSRLRRLPDRAAALVSPG